MELRISNHIIKTYNDINVSLKYDSVASTFSAALYFNPDDPVHRQIFKPLTYHTITITHGGVLVLTGKILNHRFGSAGDPPKQLVHISGYSKTGILEDSCILNCIAGSVKVDSNSTNVTVPDSPLQFDGMTLENIARTVTGFYKISVVVDPELKNDPVFNAPYETVVTRSDMKIAAFLDDLCKQKNVVLSHTNRGELLLTRVKANKQLTTTATLVNVNQTPVSSDLTGAPSFNVIKTSTKSKERGVLYDFSKPGKWTSRGLNVNGQKMHRVIQVVGEQSEDNAIQGAIANPYVQASTYSYIRVIQTAGTGSDTPDTARSILNDELKNITLSIDMEGWVLNGHLVTPNQIVTVTDPDMALYTKSRWFIQEATLHGDEKEETASLTCLIPECFNNDGDIKNVFG